MLSHYEDFLVRLAENMQARCANSFQRDLFSVSLIYHYKGLDNMKQCEYCAKQIDYNHQYCCDECEKQSLYYYARQKRSERPVSVINFIAFFGVIVGGFCAALFNTKLGSLLCAVMLTLLGIAYLIFPYAPDNIVKKYKIMKSIKIIRIIALGFLAMAAVLSVLAAVVF